MLVGSYGMSCSTYFEVYSKLLQILDDFVNEAYFENRPIINLICINQTPVYCEHKVCPKEVQFRQVSLICNIQKQIQIMENYCDQYHKLNALTN